MSSRDRHLLRPSTSSSSSAGASAAPRASSSVVGLIPPAVHADLRRAASTSSSALPVTGLLDPSGSGLAVAVYRDDDLALSGDDGAVSEVGADVVAVWVHSTQTLSEDLLAPERAAKFVHPEPGSGGEDGAMGLHAGLVALAPYAGGARSGRGGGLMSPPGSARRGYIGGADGAPAHSLYVCSPTGLLCLWNDALNLSSLGSFGGDDPAAIAPECDAACRIPLDEEEYVTSVTCTAYSSARSPSSGRGGDAPVIIGTSFGKVWMCVRTNRPLQLRARPLRHKSKSGGGGGGGEASGGGTILGWLLGSAEASSASAADEGGEEEEGPSGAVSSILALPRLSPTLAAGGVRESPRKAARTRLSDPTSFLAIHSGVGAEEDQGAALTLSKWTLRRDEDESIESGALSETRDFHHSLPVASVEGLILTAPELDRGVRITALEPLRSSVSSDGRCLVIAACVVLSDGSTGVEEGRLYLLKCTLDGIVDAEGRELDLSLDGARWLDRHSSDSVLEGRVECAGLAVRCVDFSFEGTSNSGGGSYAAYSVWHDPSVEITSRGSAVVSTVRFISGGEDALPQTCDVDLPPDVIPTLISGAVADDPATDGAVLVGSSGCVANFEVDFPFMPSASSRRMSTPSRSPSRAGVGGAGVEEDVQSLTSHLLSAFASHLRRLRAASSSKSSGRHALRRGASADVDLTSSLPPSIPAASSRSLSSAAVAASSFLCDRGDPTADLAFASPAASTSGAGGAMGAYDSLLERMDVHVSFVNFLIHAGVYRRITTEGRRGLRDGGERVAGSLAAADLLEDEVRALAAKRRKSKGGGQRGAGREGDEEWKATLSHFLSELLEAGVTTLPARLLELQSTTEGATPSDSIDQMTGMPDADPTYPRSSVGHMSTLLCEVINSALRFREERSNDLYDVAVRARVPASGPWTSDADLLTALTRQLELIGGGFKTASTATSTAGSADEKTASQVRTLASALLSGHYDLPALERNESLYDLSKKLVVPLVRKACRNGEEGEELALRLSVEHGYFEGVVQICRDNSEPGAKAARGGNGEGGEEEDESNPFDLARILSMVCASDSSGSGEDDTDDPLEVLRTSVDYTTDLSFPQFVLKWHADRGLDGTVLDLGRHCPPDVLTSYLEEDERMESYRWIQDVRTGRHDAAADKLLRLANGGKGGKGMELCPSADLNQKQSLDDRKVALSLGKLADSLSKTARTDSAQNRKRALDDGLLLAQVQETLRSASDGDGGGAADPADDEPLTAPQLVRLAVDSAPEGGIIDSDELREARVNCLLAGLAAAETLDRGAAKADAAAEIWAAAVRDDAERWAELGGILGNATAKDLPEEERRALMFDTVFSLLAARYEEGKREIGGAGAAIVGGVGFNGNSDVRDRVVASLMEGSGSPAGSGGGGDNGRGLAEALAVAAAEA